MANLMLPLLLGVVGGAWFGIRAAKPRLETRDSRRILVIVTAVAAPVALASMIVAVNVGLDAWSPWKPALATLAAGAVGAAWLVAAGFSARLPERIAWLTLIVLGVAVAALGLAASAGDVASTLVVIVPLLGVLAVAPVAAASAFEPASDARLRWGAYAVVGVLGLAAVGALPAALFGLSVQPNEAHHQWDLSIAGTGPYEVRIEMLDAAVAGPSLDVLRAELVAGLRRDGAQASWDENGTVLSVAADARLAAQAGYRFMGSVEHREAFPPIATPLFVAVEASDNVTVRLRVDHSGGQGHTCWERAEFSAVIAPGQRVMLDTGHEDGLPLICA